MNEVFFIAVIAISFLVIFGKHYMHDEKIRNLLKEIPSCSTIEENVDKGIFYGKVNRVNCSGVVKDIPVSDYINAIAVLKDK